MKSHIAYLAPNLINFDIVRVTRNKHDIVVVYECQMNGFNFINLNMHIVEGCWSYVPAALYPQEDSWYSFLL
jgi:hypothetical protein